MGDMSRCDARVSGEICHGGPKDSTGGATLSKGKAVRAMTEVGGLRSSDDPAPDLWFGQPAEERRDATCSAEVKSNEGRGDGPQGLPAPKKPFGNCKIALGHGSIERWRCDQWNSESRMRENRPPGLMRDGKQTVIGLGASQSVALPYSIQLFINAS